VTDHCYDTELPAWKEPHDDDDDDEHSKKCGTKFIAEELLGSYPEDMDVNALKRGCRIAHGIRMSISENLGFTLSAGISTSKTVAKLASSMGKPNGQAIIVPQAIPFVREQI
jgi:nucleotidyltransferase/DNA polymerase involved in DNA repair